MSTPQPPQYPYQQPPQGWGPDMPPQQPPAKKRKKWPWVLLGIFVLFIVFIVIIVSAISSGVKSVTHEANKVVNIHYSVTSDGQTADIIDTDMSNGQLGQSSANGTPVPYNKDVQITGLFKTVDLMATADQNATTITCTITADGKVVATRTGTGPMAIVDCSYTP